MKIKGSHSPRMTADGREKNGSHDSHGDATVETGSLASLICSFDSKKPWCDSLEECKSAPCLITPLTDVLSSKGSGTCEPLEETSCTTRF